MSFSYQDPTMIHDKAVHLLTKGNSTEIISALISIGLNDPDWEWAQDVCIQHLKSDNEDIASAAVNALGHIARRHEKLHLKEVTCALEDAQKKHPSLAGTITDTLDDIEIFITSR